jgi:Phage integrase family
MSGMRPGEILALQWKHVALDHVNVVHRLYRGKLDRPKSERSQRTVALSSTTRTLIERWRQQTSADPDVWVFPSAQITAPLGRDNTWRRLIAPKFKTIGLDWATFQTRYRRTKYRISKATPFVSAAVEKAVPAGSSPLAGFGKVAAKNKNVFVCLLDEDEIICMRQGDLDLRNCSARAGWEWSIELFDTNEAPT